MSYWVGVSATILASFSWAFAAVLYRIGLKGNSNIFRSNAIRVPLAIVVLLLIAFINGSVSQIFTILGDPKLLLFIVIATFTANLVGDTLYLLAIRKLGVSLSYLISYSYPVLVGLLSIIFLGEPVSIPLFIGTTIAFIGVWFISSRNEESNVHNRRDFTLGVLSSLGAAMSWAVAIVIYRMLVLNINPIALNILKLLVLLLMLFPLSVRAKEDEKISGRNLILICIGGLFGIGLGDLLFYVGLLMLGASLAAALTVTAPMLSVILANLVLKEEITTKTIYGTSFITVGVLIVTVFH